MPSCVIVSLSSANKIMKVLVNIDINAKMKITVYEREINFLASKFKSEISKNLLKNCEKMEFSPLKLLSNILTNSHEQKKYTFAETNSHQ